MELFFVDADIARAKTLHTDFYNKTEHVEAAKECIFKSSWQLIDPAVGVPEHGNCFPFFLMENFVDEPLVLTNDNGHIHCLSNACTHRGNLVVNEPCKVSKLTCRYHGRLFSTSGKFQFMPEFKEVKDFPSEADDLKQLPLFNLGKLLFTSVHPVVPAADFFSELLQRLHCLPFDEFVFDPSLSKDYNVNANWALYCENYLEGFHIPFAHPALNAALDFGNYSTELYEYSSLQLGIAKHDEDCFDLPLTSADYGKKVAAYYYFIFPNLMLNFYPWGLSVNVVKPQSQSKTIVSFYTYVWNADKLHGGAGGALDTTEMEDEQIVEAVQKGIRSSFYQHGRYSVKHEKGTHHFHRLIADFMKKRL
ncbi:SRPBCC family protein [soil metagenome]